MERNAFLAGTPLFSGVASQEVGAMLDCLDAHERRYAQGERIHHMGDSVSTAGIVLTGRVRIEHVDPWGNVSVVGMRGPGAMFGEAYAAAGEPLLVDVVADQDCTVLFLNLAKVVGPCSCRCDHHALVARNMIAAIARQSLALSRRIFHVAPKSIRGKVLAYLSNEAERAGTREFDIPFNRQQLADYLGVDRSALSAELSRMQKAGLIRCRRTHFALPHSPSNSTVEK